MSDAVTRLGVGAPRCYPKITMRFGGLDRAKFPFFCGISGRDNVEGTPSAPCLKMERPAEFRFRWGVLQGQRRISVSVKQASNCTPRPSLKILANPDLDISETEVFAGGSTAWETIGPVIINPTDNGVLIVALSCNQSTLSAEPCYWDHLVTT